MGNQSKSYGTTGNDMDERSKIKDRLLTPAPGPYERVGGVLTALSLFSGIGGLDIAAHAAGIETVGFCEIEPFAVKVLERRFPGVPIVDDVRKIRGCDWSVDVVHGGFPCQDLSCAGKQKGLKGERSGLWYEMLRVIAECRPRFVLAENVRGAINLALDTVQSGMEGEGYEVRTLLLPAAAFGAPHKRERMFVVGVRKDVAYALSGRLSKAWSREQAAGVAGEDTCCAVADSDKTGLQGRQVARGIREVREEPGDEFSGRSSEADGAETGNRNADKPERSGGTLWPSPVASDGSCGGIISPDDTYVQKASGLFRKINRNGTDGSVGLARMVKLWPTPCANDDNKSPEAHMAMKRRMGRNTITSLQVRIKQEHNGGQLNPEWVEILMGFPIGWTDTDCDEPEPWPGWPALMGERLWPTHTAGNHYRQGQPAPSEGNGHGKTLGGQCHEILDQYPWEPPRTCTKLPNRAARLKALGNSVVPAQAYPFFDAIAIMEGVR